MSKKKKAKDENSEKKHNLEITEEGVVAVQDFNIDVADKEFIVLVGPSGCGRAEKSARPQHVKKASQSFASADAAELFRHVTCRTYVL